MIRAAAETPRQEEVAALLRHPQRGGPCAMYTRAGFAPRGPFPPNEAGPISRFLEKPVSSRSPPPAR